jgi:hypothetical protein
LGIKDGQIAHVDRDASNSRIENLAFLCLQHHDQYDTRRSQSKGFTEAELLHYRANLYQSFNQEARPFVSALERESSRDDLFSEFSGLVPEKWKHVCDEALRFYTGPHRTQSAVLAALDGPKSAQAIAEQIPPNDLTCTQVIIDGAVQNAWLQQSRARPDSYVATVRARVLLEALAEIPEAVKAAAVRKIWHPDED